METKRERPSEHLTVRVEKSTYTKIRLAVQKSGKTRSEYLRRMINEVVNPQILKDANNVIQSNFN